MSGEGAVGGLAASDVSVQLGGTGYGDGITELQLARAAISAAAGCAASAAAGGKCAPAAVTAAFASLYNGDSGGRQFAVGAGQFVGVLGGFLAGGTFGGGCALLTAGTCTPIGLEIAVASGITGYAVGGRIAGDIYDAVTAVFKGGESSATADGRAAHGNYGTALGDDYDTGVVLPSGKKPDAVNWGTREVRELKPDNPRAIRLGERQVEGYRQELEQVTGKPWSAQVDTYRPGGSR